MSEFQRAAMLERLGAREFDVLVIGAGITGCGVALDAASRGLAVALVERADFASGTSSKSSKLIHGGLRYLKQRELSLVYDALHERSRLMANAPHLVRLLPFLIPILTRDGLMNAKVARGFGSVLWAYDVTGGWRVGKLHRRLERGAALSEIPTLDAGRLASAYVYYDAHADDARLTLTVARTAAAHGAVVVNYAAARALTKDRAGRVTGALVDADGTTIEVRAHTIVNAAGVWSDDVASMDEGQRADTTRPAKGVHVVVPWSRVRNRMAAVLPVRSDGRSLFLVPEPPFAYLGTTDTDYDGSLDAPTCTAADVAYVLDAANASLTAQLTPADVLGTWAGLRPLVRDAVNAKTADLSRRHRVVAAPSGVVTISGGKLTTYRQMAADTVDALAGHLDRPLPRSRTARLALLGANGAAGTDDDHLARRYGALASEIRYLIESDSSLSEPLVPGLAYLQAEAVYAVRHEMARTLSDVLDRRTRARLFARDDTARAADAVAALIGDELGWDPQRRRREVDDYRRDLEAERLAAELPHTSLAAFTDV